MSPQAVRSIVGKTLQKRTFLRTYWEHGADIVRTWWGHGAVKPEKAGSVSTSGSRASGMVMAGALVNSRAGDKIRKPDSLACQANSSFMNYPIESAENTEQIIQLLEDKIYAHNAAQTDKHDGRLFAFVIRNENKEAVAGIGGWTWAGICEITQLWVDASVRKNGIGRKLLAAAEAEAQSKGCKKILVRSYHFQAPEFYKRYGYRVGYELKDFPKGYSYYLLTKTI